MPTTQPALLKSGQRTLSRQPLKQAKHTTTEKHSKSRREEAQKHIQINTPKTIHKTQIPHQNTINPESIKATITKNQ